MRKIASLIIILTAIIIYSGTNEAISATAQKSAVKSSAVKAQAKPSVNTPDKTNTLASTMVVSPSNVVANPDKYLNKNITFNADFISFTSLGLDYKPAFRDSKDYIGILIQRDDIQGNVIPLSEMKIFLARELAEKNLDLEQGDKIKISGTVFSNALGDTWVDVKTFNVLTHKKKEAENK